MEQKSPTLAHTHSLSFQCIYFHVLKNLTHPYFFILLYTYTTALHYSITVLKSLVFSLFSSWQGYYCTINCLNISCHKKNKSFSIFRVICYLFFEQSIPAISHNFSSIQSFNSSSLDKKSNIQRTFDIPLWKLGIIITVRVFSFWLISLNKRKFILNNFRKFFSFLSNKKIVLCH